MGYVDAEAQMMWVEYYLTPPLLQLNSVLSNSSSQSSVKGAHKENYLLGIIAVLCTCVTAGFAGEWD